ncbi:MAG TPA: site-specific integrase, partial [Gaiellaceae bacterium]|nr:site-specific integrase [Gaiellaceae bacterium]
MSTTRAIERFLEHGGLAESTRRAYGSDLRLFAAWLDERALGLDDGDARVVADWVAELGRGRSRLA